MDDSAELYNDRLWISTVDSVGVNSKIVSHLNHTQKREKD